MEIKYVAIETITPYENNPRKISDKAIQVVANSIEEFGFKQPIVVDKNNVIVAGHTRYRAANRLGLTRIPVLMADDLTDEQITAYRLADNKTAEFSEWDFGQLDEELGEIFELDMADFGFSKMDADLDKRFIDDNEAEAGSLVADYIVPPFSVFDTRQGYWQDRKREWLDLGIKGELGRDAGLAYTGGIAMSEDDNGTSVFDPVLCEVMYRWFGVKDGLIFDPFSGGSVRGIVATKSMQNYIGIDLSERQIEANKQNAAELGIDGITWINDDSYNMDAHIKDGTADLVFTCPPYFDLKVYSDNPADLSQMDFDTFTAMYTDILHKSVAKLKDNRFAIVVISNVRDKKGYYRDLTGITRRAMEQAGALMYNEIILVNCVGTGAARARQNMKTKKVVRLHQEVLVFYKGDPKKIGSILCKLDDNDDFE